MPIRRRGYVWTPPAGMTPALLCAEELMHTRSTPSGLQCWDCWVLDYNFTAGERVRVATSAAPWCERPACVAHLYPPRLPYWEAPRAEGGGTDVHCVYLMFADSGTLALDAQLGPRTRHARFFDERGFLGELLNQLVNVSVTEQADGYWHAQARFFQIVALLSRAEKQSDGAYRIVSETPTCSRSLFVQAIHTYFLEHLPERISLDTLAKHLDMSVSTLSHRYRAEVGEPPMATLKRERIHLAKALLAKGYQLKTIAVQVGFSDEFHLSKTFKQLEGVTPSSYQRATTHQR